MIKLAGLREFTLATSRKTLRNFPGGLVAKDPPSSAGDWGSTPD